jgi:hypothetical protein
MGMLESFAADFANTMAWVIVGFLIGAVPYYVVSRRRPERRDLARGVYVGLAMVAAFLISDRYELVPWGETDIGPVIESGRIERPDDGFAVTFPDEWTAYEASTEYNEEALTGTAAEDRLAAIIVGVDAETGAGCVVFGLTRFASAAGWSTVEGKVAETEAVPIELPAGPAARHDAVDQAMRHEAQYTFVNEGEWFMLSCDSSLPFDVRWLSVAETFEFLPAEE